MPTQACNRATPTDRFDARKAVPTHHSAWTAVLLHAARRRSRTGASADSSRRERRHHVRRNQLRGPLRFFKRQIAERHVAHKIGGASRFPLLIDVALELLWGACEGRARL